MKWAHLPVAGGLYDQHPDFIDACYHVFHVRSEMEAKKQKEDKQKAEAERRRASGRSAGSRRR